VLSLVKYYKEQKRQSITIMTNNKYNMAKPPSFVKTIGPSIIFLGLGLGSGELILWPYLVSNYGLGIIWAAVLGITFQFFINMEIVRYSLLYGESIFAGFSRISKRFSYWFILSTFIPWIWPGIIATSAKVFATIFGIENFALLAIILLILIGIILTLGPRLYQTVETFQKTIIIIGVPIITIITFLLAKPADFTALTNGLIGVGEGYLFLPLGIPLFTFLGALAYSGAGGNLNLSQSFYIKEKGYGMCKNTKGITSVLTGNVDKVQIFGNRVDFKSNENFKKYKMWWRLVNLEHLIVFLITGALTIILLALLAYTTTLGTKSGQGVEFLIDEFYQVSSLLSPTIGIVFLALLGTMLFGTQLTVLDSTSRIISENIVILKDKLNLPHVYYLILWIQIIAAIIIFLTGYTDPISLVVTGAALNAFAMFFHIVATYFLNKRFLPEKYQPSFWRKLIILIAWLMFGILSVMAILQVF
jgi:hypothetical protein